MSLLHELRRTGALRTLDDALAGSLRRLAPDLPDAALAAAALASLAVSRGHAALDLAQPRLLVDEALPWPSPGDWAQALAGGGTGAEDAGVGWSAPGTRCHGRCTASGTQSSVVSSIP